MLTLCGWAADEEPSTAPAGDALLAGLAAAAPPAAAAERVAASWESLRECLSSLSSVGGALEESAAGMAAAIQQIRLLGDDGAGHLVRLESLHRQHETETQLKLAIIESLPPLLERGERSGASVQVLLTKYGAAWSTLPYCDAAD